MCGFSHILPEASNSPGVIRSSGSVGLTLERFIPIRVSSSENKRFFYVFRHLSVEKRKQRQIDLLKINLDPEPQAHESACCFWLQALPLGFEMGLVFWGKCYNCHTEEQVICSEGLLRALAIKATSPHLSQCFCPCPHLQRPVFLCRVCFSLASILPPVKFKTKGSGTTLTNLKLIFNTF